MDIDISRIIDAEPAQRVLRLGTDVLEDLPEELERMIADEQASHQSEYGAIYCTAHAEEYWDGRSPRFQEIIATAEAKGYAYVWFDRDIETRFEPVLDAVPGRSTRFGQLRSQVDYVHNGGCPMCGPREKIHAENADIEGGSVEIDGDGASQRVTCILCGGSWDDRYRLQGYGSYTTDNGDDCGEAEDEPWPAATETPPQVQHVHAESAPAVANGIALNDRELAHVLASLRYADRLAGTLPHGSGDPLLMWETEPEAEIFGNQEPLDGLEVDALCERLNCGPDEAQEPILPALRARNDDLLRGYDSLMASLEGDGQTWTPERAEVDKMLADLSLDGMSSSGHDERPPIRVIVQGGVVQSIGPVPPGVVVEVRDYDCQDATEESGLPRDEDGNFYEAWQETSEGTREVPKPKQEFEE